MKNSIMWVTQLDAEYDFFLSSGQKRIYSTVKRAAQKKIVSQRQKYQQSFGYVQKAGWYGA